MWISAVYHFVMQWMCATCAMVNIYHLWWTLVIMKDWNWHHFCQVHSRKEYRLKKTTFIMLERISCSFIKMYCYWCFGKIPSDRQNNRFFCGDNCNKNFGGTGIKGMNNVFSEPNKSLQLTLHNACCATHTLHSQLHSSAAILSIDIKSIVNKIFH